MSFDSWEPIDTLRIDVPGWLLPMKRSTSCSLFASLNGLASSQVQGYVPVVISTALPVESLAG